MAMAKTSVCVAAMLMSAGVFVATSVKATANPLTATLAFEEDQGCGQGFWRHHPDDWGPTGYFPDDLLGGICEGAVFYGLDGATMMEALSFKGGSSLEGAAAILLREAVTAVLNAAHPDVDYPSDELNVVIDVEVALAIGDRETMTDLADELDEDNNLYCPFYEEDEEEEDEVD